MGALRTAVGTPATAADLRAAVEAWFAPGGGMDTDAALYPDGVPSATPAKLLVAPGETLTLDATASDPALRGIMSDLAMGMLTELLPDQGERREALRGAGVGLLGDEAGLANLQGRVGSAEGQSERALVRLRSERNALELARGEVLEVDRYETATRFQTAEAAVETLYLVTSRLTGLTLANYLR
jgi:flagellar hook-associated protein 3 FlgL